MDVAVNAANMQDLTPLATELDKTLGGWYDGPKSVVIREDGTWRALPIAVFGQYWHYRTDLIPTWPSTWEELHKIA